ncbi:lipase [Klugiella xanthotipulae]|uniref:lipase n=1 Tax=Klugiella xanthotipulae TaxID=244735 RepID=UPI001FECFDD6|nr:lipase [Klugiella xanthotipulae]
MAVVTAVTFALTASPATAAVSSGSDFFSLDDAAAAASVTQALDVSSTTTNSDISVDLETFNVIVDGLSANGISSAGHNFDVQATIDQAISEIGSSRQTGWGMPGECIISAKRWILAGGGNWTGSGSPVANYVGAAKVPLDQLAPGDVIQYQYSSAPAVWATGVHTVLVVGVNDDGTLNIIESNNPAGSGRVQAQKNWKPQPPSDFEAVGWRF